LKFLSLETLIDSLSAFSVNRVLPL